MLPANALASWAAKQRELLDRYYDEAWARGVAAYVPDADPDDGEDFTPEEREHMRRDGQAAVAAVYAARHRKFVAPKQPDPNRKAQALRKAYASIDKMVGEVTAVNTTPELAPGSKDHPGRTSAAAVAAWAKSNAYRLAMGAGLAVWGGEQHGFAQAANADGKLLAWICADDDASCGDCEYMGDQPPMAEADWPAFPGDGSTQCGGGCRCTMDYVSAAVGALATL